MINDMSASRRQFLQFVGAGAAALGLAACGSDDDASPAATGSGGDATTPTTVSSSTDATTATGASTASSGVASSGGSLRILALDGSPNDTLDPLAMERAFQILAAPLIFEALVDLDEQLIPQPRLAESFDSPDEGKTWNFVLRSGVTFHDGSALTAKDVAFSITRALDPDAGSGNSLAGQLDGILLPDGIVVVDDTNIRFELAKAYVFFPNAMATRFARIYKADTTDFASPVGTGPFTFKSFEPGQRFVAERNPDFWRNEVLLDEVVITNVSDDASRIASLLAGDADLVFEIPLGSAPDVTGTDGYTVLEQPNARWLSMALDSKAAPFDKPEVAKAIKLALDRQQIIDNALGGYGTIGYDTPIAEQDKFFGGLPKPVRDVDAAKALLATAGYPDGLDLPAVIGLSDETATMAFLQVAQQQLAEAGIRFEITPESGATYYDDSWLIKPSYSNTYLRRHPDEILKLVFLSTGKWNQSKRTDPDIDAAITAAGETTVLDDQIASYTKAQELIAANDTTVIPAHFPRLSAISKSVTGVTTNPVFFLEIDQATVA
jgi:peptide/nickel transport system substrate-binding protein